MNWKPGWFEGEAHRFEVQLIQGWYNHSSNPPGEARVTQGLVSKIVPICLSPGACCAKGVRI